MAKLFEKVNIGGVELKNRLVMTPMGFMAYDADGGMSVRCSNYLVERAKGGFGLIYPPAHNVTTEFEAGEASLIENFNQANRLGILVDKIHSYGAKVCMQLTIGLGRVNFVDPYTAPKSSSATPSFWFPNLICEPYTVDEIKYLIQKFANAARLVKGSGCDMIEIHAYGGYLIDQFMTACWNNRTDEYGGETLRERMKILFELRDAIRAVCGDDYPIAVKVTPDHCFEGGRTLEEGIEMVKILDEEGFALIHLDMGAYEAWNKAVTTTYEEHGVQLYIAEAVKKAGVKTPLLVQGKLNIPELAEKVVADGTAELVGLGHQAIADPYWPRKVKNGQLDEIRYCIGCNECCRRPTSNKNQACAVNPYYNFEGDLQLTPASEKENVLVIGGGPGGMVTALTAAERGYSVELWEKEDTLGGALKAAGAPEFKLDAKLYMEYLKNQIAKSDIKVVLNKTATEEDILAANPDAVILAAGAKPIIPNIPGINGKNVMEATELLAKGLETGEKVVVLGGGLVGCEAALHLDSKGKDVTIVEMLDGLLMTVNHNRNCDMAIKEMLAKSNINAMTGTKLLSVGEGKVTVSAGDKEVEVPCDTLVVAVGYKADHTLGDALEGKIKKVITIGDNVKPGKVIDATQQGFNTIRVLEDLI